MGPDRLEDFAGRWQLRRRIIDALAGVEGAFEGTAEFRPAAHGFVYDERGWLTYAGQAPLEGTRRYLWREERPGRIVVDHADGDAFHRFSLGAVAEAKHTCSRDLYFVTYDFTGWPRWRATWRVNGPRKGYVSVTDYQRDEAGAAP
jgi:hypothetical protein